MSQDPGHVSISLVVHPPTKHIDMQLLMRLLIMQLQSRDDDFLHNEGNFENLLIDSFPY